MWKKVSEYFILVCASCFHPSFPRPLSWPPSPAHIGWKGKRKGCWCCILASIPRVSHKQQGLRVFWRHHQQGNLPNQPQFLPNLTYSTGDVTILKCHSSRSTIYCDKVIDLEKKKSSHHLLNTDLTLNETICPYCTAYCPSVTLAPFSFLDFWKEDLFFSFQKSPIDQTAPWYWEWDKLRDISWHSLGP